MSGKQCSGIERVIRIVRGEPSDDELAALTVVLARLTTVARPADPGAAGSTWADKALGLRTPHHPGPDTWRTSMRPR